MHSGVNISNGSEPLATEKRENHSLISNDDVVNLFYSIYEEFGQEPLQIFKSQCISDRKQKLHDIICSKLRFPSGSVLKGNFHVNYFKIEVVNDVEEYVIERQCELHNLTLGDVIETYNGLEQKLTEATVQERSDKFRQVLCEKLEIEKESVDSSRLQQQVINKMTSLRKLKERKDNENVERRLATVYYLPVRKKNLLKVLRNRKENINLAFLQKQNKTLTNGLLVDVFKAVNKDVKELRKVLCSQFTKLCSVKEYTLYKKAVEIMDEAEKFKENELDGELKTFMNLSPFKTLYSAELLDTEEANGNKKDIQEKCDKSLDDKYLPCHSLETKSLTVVSDSDTDVEDPCNSENTLEEDEKPSLLLDVQTECDIKNGIENKKKRKARNNAFKLIVVKEAERTSNRAAARKFDVVEKQVRCWRKLKNLISERPKDREKNVTISPKLALLEKDLCKWFLFNQSKGVILGKKEIMTKGKSLAKDPKYNLNTSYHLFQECWCGRFLKSYNLTLCRKKRRGEVLGLSHCNSVEETNNESESWKESDDNESDAFKDLSIIKKDPIDEDYKDSTDAPDIIKVVIENDLDNSAYYESSEAVIMKATVDSSDQRIKLSVIGNASDENEGNDTEGLDNDVKGDTSDKNEGNDTGELDNDVKGTSSDKYVGIDTEEISNDVNISGNTILKSPTSSNEIIQIKEEVDETPLQRKENITAKGVKRKYSKASADKIVSNTNNGEIKGKQKKAKMTKTTKRKSNKAVSEDIDSIDRTHLETFENDLIKLAEDDQKLGADISAKYLLTKAKILCKGGKYGFDFYDSMFSKSWAQQFLERHKLLKDTMGRREDHCKKVGSSSELQEASLASADELEALQMLEEQTKKKPRQSYDFAFKRNVVSFAESSSNRFAARVFKIPEKNVRAWRKAKETILTLDKDRKRRIPKYHYLYAELDNDIGLWCKKISQSGKMLIHSEISMKAKQLIKEKNYGADMTQFKASLQWCKRVLKIHGLSLVDARSLRGKVHHTDVKTVDKSDVDDSDDDIKSVDDEDAD